VAEEMLSLAVLLCLAAAPDPALLSLSTAAPAAADTSLESLIGPPSTRFT